MEMNELITLLNDDLKREYAAALQYFQHASVISGTYSAFSDLLYEHANDEIEHANKISEYINFLGGWPVAIPGNTFTATEPVDMLSQDFSGEKVAIAEYSARVEQVRELGLWGLEKLLLEILNEEENHANDIKTILAI